MKPVGARGRSAGAAPLELEGGGSHEMLSTRVYNPQEVDRAVARAQAGRVTLFLSCHGGAGGTTLATTLGAILARSGARVCVLDLDLQFGNVLTALNLNNSCPIASLVQETGTADLFARLPRHPSGLAALSQVGNVDAIGEVRPTRLPQLLHRLRRSFDYLLIDGVRDFTDHALPAMDTADDFVLVVTQDVLAMRGLVMRLDLLRRLRFDRAAVHVLVNRYNRRSPISLATMETGLGIAPSFTVRNDFKAVQRALNEGKTLLEVAPRSAVTTDTQGVARDLYQIEIGTQRLRRRRKMMKSGGAGGRSRT